jgi:hypothetical protein
MAALLTYAADGQGSRLAPPVHKAFFFLERPLICLARQSDSSYPDFSVVQRPHIALQGMLA